MCIYIYVYIIHVRILHSINMNLIYVSLQPLEDHPPSGRLSLWPVLPGFLRKLWVCYHNHIYI